MANGIPEWLTPALVLGVIGTTTGVLALILHFLRFRRERPDLKVDVIDCRHRASAQVSTNLNIKYTVHNKGDRGTQLYRIEASATDFKGKKHHVSKELSQHINASDSLTLSDSLFFKPHFQYREIMNCSFKLHHTHGKFQFKCESKESTKPLKYFLEW